MPPRLPDGEPVPPDGTLPPWATDGASERPLAVYVHVPFCRVRCGYCDFNTYTLGELSDGASPSRYVEAARAEIELARRILGGGRQADTVFFGGGTPTMLAPDQLGSLLGAIADGPGLAPGAEVTLEANPDSVDDADLRALVERGFTRISVGVQSFTPHVLATLDRTHDPANVERVVRGAREAGFASVSLDLIYGTPGETVDEWADTVRRAVDLGPDHISAYSLIVEEGTALARRVRRGELPPPDEDDLADKYEVADELLEAAGLQWYEVSNWARGEDHVCRHNLHYWRSADWWGVGPGAHSHVGGVRWWNVKHPAAYAARLGEGLSPAHGRELLDPSQRDVERVLLETRLRGGVRLSGLDADAARRAGELVQDRLLTVEEGSLVLTRRGRLLADAVVRTLLG